MARHGRFSRGCQTCRRRKIKCDEASSGCGQCQKAGWTCPLYADAVDRMFQDQFKKCDEGQSAKTVPITSYNTRRTESSCPTMLTENPKKSPFSHLQMIDDYAMAYFLAKHVFRESGIARGHFEFLSVYTAGLDTDETLSTSLKAVALTAYARKLRYPALIQKSRIYYHLSINGLRKAIAVAHTSDENTDAHMSGATRCISLRANQILKSQHGLQLFLQTSWCRLATCILRSRRLPEELIRTRRYAARFLPTNDPAWMLSDIMERVAGFRAGLVSGTLCNTVEIVDIVTELDHELLVLAGNMPVEWSYQRISAAQDPKLVFGSYFHVYPDLWIACIWNFIRACRLVLLKEICRRAASATEVVLPALLFRYGCDYRGLDAVVESLTADICATVPQFCDYLHEIHVQAPITKSDVPTTASVYHVLWPMLNAVRATLLGSQRCWIIDRCYYIGNATGIQQVLALASFLETWEDVDCWLERHEEDKILSMNIGE